jgi:chemotaxis protein histidine kinase CheA
MKGLPHANAGDVFEVCQSGDSLSVYRVDAGGKDCHGWGMALQFKCAKGTAKMCARDKAAAKRAADAAKKAAAKVLADAKKAAALQRKIARDKAAAAAATAKKAAALAKKIAAEKKKAAALAKKIKDDKAKAKAAAAAAKKAEEAKIALEKKKAAALAKKIAAEKAKKKAAKDAAAKKALAKKIAEEERRKKALEKKMAEEKKAAKELEDKMKDEMEEAESADFDEGDYEEHHGERAKHVMDCKKPKTFFKKTDFHGSDLKKGGLKASSAQDCCMKCTKYHKCEYWTFATKGKRKGTCWVKSSMSGVESQDDRAAGYYDPCEDPSNVEKGTDYHGSDIVKGGFQVSSAKQCCQKCVATQGCKFWTLGTKGRRKNTCWVKYGYSGWEKQGNRDSGTFVVKKDGSPVEPDASRHD